MATALSTLGRGTLTPWFRRGPLSAFRDIEDTLERLWRDEGDGWGSQMIAPPLDMSETEDTISLRMDLPGVAPNEIDVQVSGNQLTVSGERKEEQEENGKTFHRIERRYGRFSRAVILPCEVQDDKVEAKYQDGVLQINLPKTAEATARRIEVKS
jgi:HSP20 family protein